ncbi:hypothetical protein N474_17830 [Pseudoalteromonas luteoviolacea CPMOR-2]|uniref:DUF350 domain-containing protein n=2 Tax=Pseudoalteromonas luteoviolacea TaxID=43657 RepID=A0A166VCZ8_9GAMM|nr:hypothetical protein N475_21945 [Pseudoalteromonas luteoviolacea DSM 6061]KZN54664.1 hypothetical protein N474_17830 [Pseudoalteromonas luteoviolacea CPMOR-2]MBE0386145.1 hypothetical protein [Pseudoalteromonas luteoviolacea DSM 6061]
MQSLSFVGLLLVIMLIAKWLYNFTTPYDTFNEILIKKNAALATSVAGYIVAVAIIFCAVLVGPSNGLINDLIAVAGYSLAGMVMLLVSRVINDKLILHAFCNKAQLIEKQNISTGVVQASSYIASALLIGAALHGEGGWMSALVFYVLGQITLVLFARIYDLLTSYNLMAELESGNKAVAATFSATLIALGMVLLHALIGEFESWHASVTLFFQDAVIGFVVLPLARLFIDKVIFPTVCIDKAVGEEHNMSVALVEGGVALSVASVIVVVL